MKRIGVVPSKYALPCGTAVLTALEAIRGRQPLPHEVWVVTGTPRGGLVVIYAFCEDGELPTLAGVVKQTYLAHRGAEWTDQTFSGDAIKE